MKVKIVAHFIDEEGNYAHAELNRGIVADVRDSIGKLWIEKGWAVPVVENHQAAAAGVIETPEDESEPVKRETATVRRKAQHE